jgi:hypothetical protein
MARKVKMKMIVSFTWTKCSAQPTYTRSISGDSGNGRVFRSRALRFRGLFT